MVFIGKISANNIHLDNPTLIKGYKAKLLTQKLEDIFKTLSPRHVDGLLAFYSSALEAHTNNDSFDAFVEKNLHLKMNDSCIAHASTLKEFAAYLFEVNEKEINQPFSVNNSGYKLYQSVIKAKNEVQAIKHISKQDLTQLGITLIQENHIKDLNPLYESEDLQLKSINLITHWVQEGDFEKIAELSAAMAKKKWYEATCIFEENKKNLARDESGYACK